VPHRVYVVFTGELEIHTDESEEGEGFCSYSARIRSRMERGPTSPTSADEPGAGEEGRHLRKVLPGFVPGFVSEPSRWT
jgi:hypothetical protein